MSTLTVILFIGGWLFAPVIFSILDPFF
jgi:hypothetical protein